METSATSQLLLRVDVGGAKRAVVAEFDSSSYASELIGALASDVRGGRWRVARTAQLIDGSATISSLRLRHADLIEVAPASTVSEATVPTNADGPYCLFVVGGPLAGRTLSLALGDHVIGRAPTPGVQVVLEDPTISAKHCVLRIRASGIEIQDLGSTNGTWIGDRRLGLEREILAPATVVELGGSLIQIERRVTGPEAATTYRDGRMIFNRPARVAVKFPERVVVVPEQPQKPEGRRFPLIASLGPLVIGVGMAALLNNVLFLAFSILSPAMAAFSLIEDRRSGRHGHRKALAAFQAASGLAQTNAVAFQSELVALRNQAAPSPAHLAKRALELAPSLWERRPIDEDFMALRVGSANLPTLIRFVDERGSAVVPGARGAEDSSALFVAERTTM